MDNASYHKSNPIDTPNETKASIWTKIASYNSTNVQAEMLSIACNRGYSVIYTPPYHSCLQYRNGLGYCQI
ncbi:hypothetical protein THRCLA_21464 [Thraustotheca clavata]|uniref:Tc1-like transposase DDE domain-containing protein n=1 Tax=Thraustotheca clavata TaxID=74557 RepID=A0A1V9ZWU4_9STRA|nr:hypothetical protein THRCLA_21464 [Thraustotheca clavata]